MARPRPPALRRLATVLLVLAQLIAGAAIVDRGWQRRVSWSSQLVDKGIGGDGIQYWAMAVHLEREHMVSLDGKEPTWLRLPGYPLLLRYTTRPAESDTGATDPKSIQRRVDAWMQRARRVDRVVDLGCGLAAWLLALALGGGPLSLLAAAAWAYQPWSAVVSLHTLSDPLATLLGTLCLAALAHGVRRRIPGWLLVAGLLAGLCQYVRADAILLVPVLLVGGLAIAGPRRPALALSGVLVWALVFAPWPARNYLRFRAFHPLGAPGVDDKGKPVDRAAAFAWMRTWCVGRETETVEVAWRLPGKTIQFDHLPHQAYDNADELLAARDFLRDYNARGGRLDRELTRRLSAMAQKRRLRNPWAHWVTLPLERLRLRLLPPRDGYGLGTLPTLQQDRARWLRRDQAMVGLSLLGLWLLVLRRSTRGAAVAVLAALAGRAALLGWYIPAPEPRYFLQVLPLLIACAATLPASAWDALGSTAEAVRRWRR